MSHRTPFIAAVAAAIVLSLGGSAIAQLSWSRAHSNGPNDGSLPVTTAPAGRGSVSIPEIGTFATGVTPVVASDGTFYIGNREGRVFAFRADGTPAWSRDTGNTGSITASPVIMANGDVIVVTGRTVRDHRAGAPPSGIRHESFLHRFNSGGGWYGPVAFPERDRITGRTQAPFNIWRDGAAEVLMIPVVYRVLSTTEIWILAFSNAGQFLGDAMVSRIQDEVTGSGPLLPWGVEFQHGFLPDPNPFPAIAIFRSPQGGTPAIVVSDKYHDLVGYTFALENNGQRGRFTERFRVREAKERLSVPMVMPDGHTRIGTNYGRLLFAGPNMSVVPPVTVALKRGSIYGSPTRTVDGRLVVIAWEGSGMSTMAVMQGSAIQSRTQLRGMSITRAAASHNHIFVALDNGLLTFDANTLAQVGRFPWEGGGGWPPVIGPQGHVYAIAKSILFVFRPPAGVAQPRQPLHIPPDAVGSGAVPEDRPAVRDHRGRDVRDHR